MIRTTVQTIEIKGDYDKWRKNLRELNGAHVKVGFPAAKDVGSSSSAGSRRKPFSDMSEVARVAVWNEFGVPLKSAGKTKAKRGFMNFWKIPPRPFFRNAIDKNISALSSFMDRIQIELMVGKFKDAAQALSAIGIWMQDKIKREITTGQFPPNAPSTIKSKGSSRPLIDTGQMRNSVTFIVHHGKDEIEEGDVRV